MWYPTLLFLLLLPNSWALDAGGGHPTCSLKDNCNLGDNLLAVQGTAESNNPANDKLESHIASIFEDKVNYSLKLFADDAAAAAATATTTATTVLEVLHDVLATGNISELHTSHGSNFTLHQLSDKQKDGDKDEDELEDEERVYLYNIGKRFLAISQPFDAARNPDATPLCRMQMRRYLNALNNFDLWALKMHDASGKLNSGILNGNINQPGDFDQCMSIQQSSLDDADNAAHTDSMLRGQYCLAYAQPVLPHKSKRLQSFFKLLQSHGPFRSEFNDPGHRVPRYSLINWGICVPSGCTHRDVEYTVAEYLRNQTAATGISFNVRVEQKMCQVRDQQPWDRNTTWAVRFFVLVLCVAVLSTIYDRCTKEQRQQNDWFTAFSLDKNLRWLFNTRSSPGDIESVHGIRFLNAVMLIFSHKSMAMFFNPYNNRTAMSESLGQPWTVIGRAASLYTDPFLLFSGMLTSYSLFGRLMKQQPIRLKNEYVNRLMRIVPPLAALILFCTYVLPLWGSGPQWNLVVGHHADICKQHWWRNLLFIHNYFGFSEMCLTHTHHLGIDTELFAVAPIFILGLWRWPRRGMLALLLLCTVGTAARYYTTIVNQLSNYIYFGTNIQRLFRTADYMYSFPPHRSTVYIMGILLGYALRKYQGIKLNRLQLRLGWLAATVCVLASVLGPAPMGDINYVYNSTHAAIYAAFAPIAWCLFFSWIVFVSHNGYKNKITQLFAWRGFQVSTKLSYAIYLTQFPVFFYNVGRRRHIHHYYNFVSIILDTNEFISIFLASVALTVLFDAPFQNLKKLLIKQPNSQVKSKSLSASAPVTAATATATILTTKTSSSPTMPNGTASSTSNHQQPPTEAQTHPHAD